jgi:hypothetical protein
MHHPGAAAARRDRTRVVMCDGRSTMWPNRIEDFDAAALVLLP